MSAIQRPDPEYGASGHYQGEQGEDYFLAQKTTGEVSARWNLPFWVSHTHPEGSVLDFGCGGGYLLSLLSASYKLGVEINPTARHAAQKLGLDVYPTLDEVDDYSFSRVISSHALEHIPSPLVALKQLRVKIARGGQLSLLLPLDDWRTPSHRKYSHGDHNHHLYTWTPQNLGNLIFEAGFKDIRLTIITDAMPPNIKFAKILMKNKWLRQWAGGVLGLALRRRQLFASALP